MKYLFRFLVVLYLWAYKPKFKNKALTNEQAMCKYLHFHKNGAASVKKKYQHLLRRNQ